MTTTEQAREIIDQRLDAFTNLGRRLAMGEQIAPATTADTLRDAGKTPSDLDSLIVCLKHRAGLRVKLAAAAQHDERKRQIEAQIDSANLELERAVQAHGRKCEPLQQELAAIGLAIAEAVTLPTLLARSCPDPALLARRKRLEKQLVESRELVRQAERNVEQTAAGIEHADPGDRARLAPRLDRIKTELAAAEQKLSATAREFDENFHDLIEF